MTTIHPEQFIKLLIHEIFVSRRLVVGLSVGVMMAVLTVGLSWQTGYVASTTVSVDETNIIQPLMHGAAVATQAIDRARVLRETIFGRTMMDQVLQKTQFFKDVELSPKDREAIIGRMIKRTNVTSSGRNLIKIEYRDEDAERAYIAAKSYADVIIEETLAAKVAESQAAFNFIDRQVQEYHQKLLQAEEGLKEFRSGHIDAQLGSETDMSGRLNALQRRIEEGTEHLREAEIRKQSLEKQLSGEIESAHVLSREGQYRARIADLQSQLETLKLSYHDTYPDIVRLRRQIEDLNEAIVAERRRSDAAKASGRVLIDESIINNPTYQQLKRDLSQAQIQVDSYKARVGEARRQLQNELERSRRANSSVATLSELTRDYQVNRDIYQDLLKRRENARVSMNLDRDNQGLTFKIREPATVPLEAKGLRFRDFVLMAIVLSVLVPMGALSAKVMFDPRIQLAALVTERHGVPVLAGVPHVWSVAETGVARRDIERLLAIMGGAVLVAILIVSLRMTQVI